MTSERREPVTTRVPATQKRAWAADAEALDMSQSEFVRTMVQAGRRELGLETQAAVAEGSEGERPREGKDLREQDPVEPASPGSNPGGDGLEDRVLDVLAEEGVCSWDDLLDAVVGDLEAQLDETMERLLEAGTVTYSGREGGYVRRE